MKRLLGVSLLACAGCAHTHHARNAPGRIDVHAPPAQIEQRGVEEPQDPGETMLVVSAGALGGGGIAFGGNEDTRGAYGAGPELSIGYGSNDRSHADDDFFIHPQHGLGANAGWTALSGEGSGVGPLYGELYFQEQLVYLAGGWVWDPDDQEHGPQATLTLGVFYLRGTHRFELGTELQAGVSFKLPYSWVWSR